MVPKLSRDDEHPTPIFTSSSRELGDRPVLAVIGVGYVGEHLVYSFSSSFNVIGYDVSPSRLEKLRSGNYQSDRIRFTNNVEDLRRASNFLISVPTTLRRDGSVDLSHIEDALEVVGSNARRGSIVVIESTVAIGTTRRLLEPLARSRGVFAGMSPERIDPGRVSPPANSIPKIVSALDDVVPGSLDAITRLYEYAFDTVVPVSKPEVAEMVKLYENCQRTVAIAYANEMADACIPFGIDPFEVAKTAATKPFGYLPIFPSLGIGGHCIPVNPTYFMSTCNLPLLQQAHKSMSTRPSRIASQLLRSLLDDNDRLHGASSRPRILVVGVGFKAGQSDLVNSPGVQLLNFIWSSGEVDVMFCDPLPGLDYSILEGINSGHCTSDMKYCGAPMCLFEYGLACDANTWPAGQDTYDIPRPQLGNVQYGKPFRHCSVKGTIALTFDDGPGAWTEDLLDILKSNNVKATFFITGNNLSKGHINHPATGYPDIIRRTYEEGHQIAAHTWSHMNMNFLSSKQRIEEMVKTEIALNDILGFFPTYWRPPYNACNDDCATDMANLGYHTTSYDIDPLDWQNNVTYSKENFLEAITSRKPSERSWLSLAHDLHKGTVHEFTQFMIDHAREQGFKPVRLGECLDDPEENWYRKRSTGGGGFLPKV
ncbi:vi polysaccharide biosynthesis protein vipA/tviB [Leptodontidium sp. 2 PMI_412]|nr:vi polysaccharide biosynthesis protein vipA/tviB [Leptodontidium sp. 2 PMI_412]